MRPADPWFHSRPDARREYAAGAAALPRRSLDLRDRPDFGQSARRISPSPSHRDTPGRAFGTRKGIC